MQAIIIDDSRTMRMILKRTLIEIGYEIHEAGDGQQGLDKLEEVGSVDLALVDWNMPVMSGYDFVVAVRADPRYQNMKIMMVTTEGAQKEIGSALESGADEYLMKPFSKDDLLSKLNVLGIALA